MFNSIIEKIYAAKPTVDDLLNSTKANLDDNSNFIEVFWRIVNWIIWFAGIIIFIYILISGINIITAGGNAEQAKKGQQGLVFGIIGAVIVVLSITLVRVIANIAGHNAPQ